MKDVREPWIRNIAKQVVFLQESQPQIKIYQAKAIKVSSVSALLHIDALHNFFVIDKEAVKGD